VIIFAEYFLTKNEFCLLLIFVGIILISVAILEYLSQKKVLHCELSRKLLHIIAISLAAFSIFYISNSSEIVEIGFAAVIILALAIKMELINTIENQNRKSWGIVYVAISYFVLGILWNGGNIWIILPSLLILAFADSLAAIGGYFFAKEYLSIGNDKKSYLGSAIFFFVTFLLLIIFSQIKSESFPKWNSYFEYDYYFIFSAFFIAFILTLTEAISTGGFDNFTVPVLASVLIYTFYDKKDFSQIINFAVAFVLAFFVSWSSYKFKFLNRSGAVAVFLLAVIIFSLGGLKWTIPILVFFVFSSVLSKFRVKQNPEIETLFDKSGTRDRIQVFSNGGLAGILLLLFTIEKQNNIYLLYLAAIATVCADTWATETGTIKKQNTFNILNFKPIMQGQSGGISVIGTLGGLFGAVVISLSGIFWIGEELIKNFIIISFVGLLGSLFDSLLGATVQVLYKCNQCYKITERKNHCGKTTNYFRGLRFMNNDMVNFLAAVFGVLLMQFIIMMNS
jgi:uncharacterized protein (TIGR00297 family)